MPDLATAPLGAAESAGPRRKPGAAIASVAMAAPVQTVENGPIADRLGVAEEWIVKRTGARERRIAGPGESLNGLAAEASREALARAGIAPTDLDLVLVATMTADRVSPNAAPVLAAELGAAGAGAADVGAACTGFLSALAFASGLIEAGRAEAILVAGADLMSRITDPDDRSTAALMADGAGAVVLCASDTGRVGPVVLGSDGSRSELVTAETGGTLRMNGHDTFKQAVARMGEATALALAASGRGLDEVDLFVYHQANSRIIVALGAELGLPAERVVDYVPRFGNTSAATIPMALAVAEDEGRLAPGDLVLLAAFGGGLTWGATAVEWGMGNGD